MSNVNLDSPVIQRLKDSPSEVSSALFSRALILAKDNDITLLRVEGIWFFEVSDKPFVATKGKTANEAVLNYLEAAENGLLDEMQAKVTEANAPEDTVDSTEGTDITVEAPADIIVDSPDNVVVVAKTGGMKKRNKKDGSK